LGRAAVLRLAAREADRLARGPADRDRAGDPRARRARDLGRADDARGRDRHPRRRGLRERRLLDLVPRGARGRARVAEGGVSVDGYVIRRDHGTITVTAAALQRLVVAAAESVDGVRVRRPRRGLELSIGTARTAEVTLALTAREGVVLPEL